MVHKLTRELSIPRPVEAVFDFFSDARNLEQITPPELRFRVTTSGPIEMGTGTNIHYRLSLFRIPFGWTTRIDTWDPPDRFVDVQIAGPFARWEHTHWFEASEAETTIRDEVIYELPFAPFGELAGSLVRRELDRIFDFRTVATGRILEAKRN